MSLTPAVSTPDPKCDWHNEMPPELPIAELGIQTAVGIVLPVGEASAAWGTVAIRPTTSVSIATMTSGQIVETVGAVYSASLPIIPATGGYLLPPDEASTVIAAHAQCRELAQQAKNCQDYQQFSLLKEEAVQQLKIIEGYSSACTLQAEQGSSATTERALVVLGDLQKDARGLVECMIYHQPVGPSQMVLRDIDNFKAITTVPSPQGSRTLQSGQVVAFQNFKISPDQLGGMCQPVSSQGKYEIFNHVGTEPGEAEICTKLVFTKTDEQKSFEVARHAGRPLPKAQPKPPGLFSSWFGGSEPEESMENRIIRQRVLLENLVKQLQRKQAQIGFKEIRLECFVERTARGLTSERAAFADVIVLVHHQ
jgi:hypothetical protein